jgi:hypothetical protein
MPYAYVYTGPNSIADGVYEVCGGELRLELSNGIVKKLKLAEGEDARAAACRLLRECANMRGSFYDPISYPPKAIV